MRQVPVKVDPSVDAPVRAALAMLPELRTLADVLEWARTQRPAWMVVEIVTQDEYTHDVVLGNGGGTFLVFDTT